MDKQTTKLLLPSGRGVKLAELTHKQIDDAELTVAQRPDFGPTMSAMAYNKLVSAEAIALMVVGVTEARGLKDDDLVKPETKWKALGPVDIKDRMAEHFSAKDVAFLRSYYAREFDITDIAISKILEKKVVELTD